MSESQAGKFDFKRLAALIEKAPGPAPWSYREGDAVTSELGTLRWHDAGDGSSTLIDTDGRTTLGLRQHAYAMPLNAQQILAWAQTSADVVKVFLLDFRELTAVGSPPLNPASKIQYAGEAVGTIEVPGSLRPGLNRFDFPQVFGNLPRFSFSATMPGFGNQFRSATPRDAQSTAYVPASM